MNPSKKSIFSLELGPEVATIVCDHCGKPFESVNGYIKRDDWAYSAYFATLQSGHDEIEAGLTISIGKFWDDTAFDERSWLYMRVWPSESGRGSEMKVVDPDESRHADFSLFGTKLTEEIARVSPLLDEFFAVADFLLDHDPAIRSYLAGKSVSSEGRTIASAGASPTTE